MSSHFQTIGIIGKHGVPSQDTPLKELIDYLIKQQIEVLLDQDSVDLDKDTIDGAQPVDRDTLCERCDLVFVVGGDGTLLGAARSMVDSGVPLLGINLGRLGFLADISPTDLTDNLNRILAGEYQEESRALLHARVIRDGAEIFESSAFNDVVVHTCYVARMIEFDTYISGQFMNTTRADGQIVATPTGSTAYALSGGGPIIHPSLNALVLVPVCPHTMSHRPIVVDADNHIEIVVSDNNRTASQVTCDGQADFGLQNGDRVLISKKAKQVRLIHPLHYNYYGILRAKLHWGKRL